MLRLGVLGLLYARCDFGRQSRQRDGRYYQRTAHTHTQRQFKYANPAFDDAVTRARQTLKDDERLKHYREAFAILEQDVPGIGLYQDFAIYAARRELSWKPTANEAFFVMEMKWQ